MADAPYTWGQQPIGEDRESWFRRHPWYVTVPTIGALWLVVMFLLVAVLFPVFFGGFGADQGGQVPVEQVQDATGPGRVVRQKGPTPAPTTPPTIYNGPRPCATVWPTTCNDGGR